VGTAGQRGQRDWHSVKCFVEQPYDYRRGIWIGEETIYVECIWLQLLENLLHAVTMDPDRLGMRWAVLANSLFCRLCETGIVAAYKGPALDAVSWEKFLFCDTSRNLCTSHRYLRFVDTLVAAEQTVNTFYLGKVAFYHFGFCILSCLNSYTLLVKWPQGSTAI
jgi:hypothetical protein